jgi:CDP-diacylglycerol---glycerol-3-phosphate 3-phosphatidyltransferase
MLVWYGARWQGVTSAAMFDGKFRVPIDKAVKPLGNGLRRTGLTPDHLTVMGLLVAVGAAVAIGSGWLRLGVVLVILAALPDLLDGALAKASNSSSQRGAFFDSTIDRFADALLFGGVAWYFAAGDHPLMAMLPFSVMALSSVISYMRAKAESLGLDAKGGIMERAERIIALLLGLIWEPLLIPILWITLALTAVTAVQRFVKVWKQAAVAPVTAERIELRRSRRQSRRVVRTERRHTRISRATGRTSIRRD